MRTDLRAAGAAVLAGAVLLLPIATAMPASAAEPSTVRINEVESDGGTPGDWIEIANPGDEAVDVSGYVLKDDDDDHVFTIDAGTTLAAGGILALDVDPEFGLGKADLARLFLPDGETLVDSYGWQAHAATSYGRCPDGTGEFRVTVTPTKGAPNACDADAADFLRINEVESNGGTPGDWVELVNTGEHEIDASGLVVKDSEDDHAVTVAEGTTVAPHGYLVVDTEPEYGLGGEDSARLFDVDGTTLIDATSWTSHGSPTWGRCPDVTGEFGNTLESTRGAANVCEAPEGAELVINEVESNGDPTGDWIEIGNPGDTAIPVGGWIVKDSDDTHVATIPAGSVVEPHGYFVVPESVLGFGLGNDDAARLFLPDGVTLIAAYSWGPHAATSYGRCPDLTGEFTTTTSTTKGAANDCAAPVRINEVESNDGEPGDWVELVNTGADAVDVSGYLVKDAEDDHVFTIAAGTSIAAGGYLAVDVEEEFGLGGADSARLFAPGGTTLVDSYSWTEHAATTYGRCPDGTGEFSTTTTPTKGARNACPGEVVASPWPGGAEISTVDAEGTWAENLSGLAVEPSESEPEGTLWAVQNGGPGALFRLEWDGERWASETSGGWAAGKTLHYADGTGEVDAEGVALTSAGSAGGVYVSSERDNEASSVSRPSILRYEVSGEGTALSASAEWNLADDLGPIGANSGLEGIAWVSDDVLVASGFVDETTGTAYDPAGYGDHGGGLFFVGVEATGSVVAYALDASGADFTRVASFASGFPGVMELEWDAERGALWVVCDDTCEGRTATFEIGEDGSFEQSALYERPSGMPNLNNEGFALAPASTCVDGSKPVYYSDDSSTDGHALRAGTIDCEESTDPTDPTNPTDPTDPTDPTGPAPIPADQLVDGARGAVTVPGTVRPGETITVGGAGSAGEAVDAWLYSTPQHLVTATVAADGTIRVTIPTDVELGSHRLAIVAADGTLIGWDDFTVVAAAAPASPSVLSSTGVETGGLLAAGAALLLLGAVAIVRRRRAA